MQNLDADTGTGSSFYDPVMKGYYVLTKDGTQLFNDQVIGQLADTEIIKEGSNVDSTKFLDRKVLKFDGKVGKVSSSGMGITYTNS